MPNNVDGRAPNNSESENRALTPEVLSLALTPESQGREALADLGPGEPPWLFLQEPRAGKRTLEFFVTQIPNDHTRRAYYGAVRRFSAWCSAHRLEELGRVEPLHVAAWLKALEADGSSRPTVKQHLAAVRMLFDWLVVGQIVPYNPAHAVRGPKHVVKKGKTPVLSTEEMHDLFAGFPADSLVALRDRALLATMAYTFARIGAVVQLRVEDYYIQGRRGWLRLQEKGSKVNELPCHHTLEQFLDEYLAAAGIAGDAEGPLFRTWRSGALQRRPLDQSSAHRMVRRRLRQSGIRSLAGNHSFRATGITNYLKNGGKLELAQQMAAHASPRTTSLYDRRGDEISLDEIERISY
jgi:site-specific recombinase XerD